MNVSLLEICLKDLFTDASELSEKYGEDTVKAVLRIRDMYLWLLKSPSAKDSEFVKECVGRYKVTRPTAYSDLNVIKTLLPKLSRAAKDFDRWRFTEMILETYNIAKFKKDVRTMERAAATLAKYLNLDKVEEERIPLDKIVVQPFIPDNDPRIIGFEPIPNLREHIRKLEKKYAAEVPELVDVDYEEADIRIDDPDLVDNDVDD